MSSKLKIKKGDTVTVISGSSKGHVGRVLRVLTDTGRLVVEGARVVTRHQKGSGDQPGQKIQKEAPIPASKVALVNKATGERVKVAYQFDEDGNKVRVDRKTGARLD